MSTDTESQTLIKDSPATTKSAVLKIALAACAALAVGAAVASVPSPFRATARTAARASSTGRVDAAATTCSETWIYP